MQHSDRDSRAEIPAVRVAPGDGKPKKNQPSLMRQPSARRSSRRTK